MKHDIRLLKPQMYDFELFIKRSKEAFESGCLTNNGPFVQKLESDIKSYLGGVPTAALANGTFALVLALQGTGIKGKVIVPSFTFCATAHAVMLAGLEPVFVDINPETFTLDPVKVKEAITPDVKAILAVHVFGNPCAIDELTQIATDHNLLLFFDSAHAFGSTYKGKKIGSFGRAEIFSAHATKPFMAVEGGLVTTSDVSLMNYIQKARNFGIENVVDTVIAGTNAKMSELHAIVGLDSLNYFSANLSKRRELVRAYKEKLGGIPGITFQKVENHSESSYFFFSIVVDPQQFGLSRDELAKKLEEEGIQTRKYFYLPLHQQQTYKSFVHKALLHTERIAEQILCLPTHASLTFDDIQVVCDMINKAYKGSALLPVSQRLRNESSFSLGNNLSNDSIKRVLVTGGAGYVGCVLVKKLLEKGYQVRVLDKLIFGKEPLAGFVQNPHFDLHVGQVEDKYMVEKCLQGVDAVIHLAGLSDDPSCELDADLTRRANIEATKILLDSAKNLGVKRFVYASSCSVYGFTGDTIVTEESPLNPLTTYAKSKVDCERLVQPMADSDFVTVCLRKSTIYGPSPRMRFDLVINTMTGMAMSEGKIAINGGMQWRPFLHVEDAADAYIFMLEASAQKINGQIFNVGSNDQNLQIIELAQKIAKIVPSARIEQSPSPDKRSYHANFDKINAIGWKATRNIEHGALGVKKLFEDGFVRDFRDLNYFNIKRLVTYLNI